MGANGRKTSGGGRWEIFFIPNVVDYSGFSPLMVPMRSSQEILLFGSESDFQGIHYVRKAIVFNPAGMTNVFNSIDVKEWTVDPNL